jgi:hypothetical protein
MTMFKIKFFGSGRNVGTNDLTEDNSDQQTYVQHMLSISIHCDVQQKRIKP